MRFSLVGRSEDCKTANQRSITEIHYLELRQIFSVPNGAPVIFCIATFVRNKKCLKKHCLKAMQ